MSREKDDADAGRAGMSPGEGESPGSSENCIRWAKVEAQLFKAREDGREADEDALLEQLDSIWTAMSEEERRWANNWQPRSQAVRLT